MKFKGRHLYVVGTHFGDEGKGKIIDSISGYYDYAVRFSGGSNAGHTIYHGGNKVALHLIPSAVFHANTTCVISPGVVVDPIALRDEINSLKKIGIDVSRRLFISGNCNLIFSCHKLLDKAREEALGDKKIGTTGKGIGPAYEDIVARRAMRVYDLFHADRQEKLEKLLAYYAEQLHDTGFVETVKQEMEQSIEILKDHVTNTVELLSFADQQGKHILFEGAQGSMLDIHSGTWPFVTSSCTTIAGVYLGTQLQPPLDIQVLGICKAYTTRVGSGPLPTEIMDERQDILSVDGKEFGATTGRKRRCGWLDLPLLRRTIHRNNINSLCLTKVDVLDKFDKIPVCTSYELDGNSIDYPPDDISRLTDCKPIYIELDGWKCDSSRSRGIQDMPDKLNKFIDYLQSMLHIPIALVSVGVNREQLIWCREEDLNLHELPH